MSDGRFPDFRHGLMFDNVQTMSDFADKLLWNCFFQLIINKEYHDEYEYRD